MAIDIRGAPFMSRLTEISWQLCPLRCVERVTRMWLCVMPSIGNRRHEPANESSPSWRIDVSNPPSAPTRSETAGGTVGEEGSAPAMVPLRRAAKITVASEIDRGINGGDMSNALVKPV
jgi:hypothetical protein